MTAPCRGRYEAMYRDSDGWLYPTDWDGDWDMMSDEELAEEQGMERVSVHVLKGWRVAKRGGKT